MLHDGQRALELLGELNTLDRLEGLVREQVVGDEGSELNVQAHIALHKERLQELCVVRAGGGLARKSESRAILEGFGSWYARLEEVSDLRSEIHRFGHRRAVASAPQPWLTGGERRSERLQGTHRGQQRRM